VFLKTFSPVLITNDRAAACCYARPVCGRSYVGNVRFTPKSRHWNAVTECPLCAKSRHSASQQNSALRGLSFDRRVGAQLEALKGSLDFRYPHLGFNRVGNETILMGGVMHPIELFRTGLSVVAPHNPWTKFDAGNRELPVGILLKVANRLVLVRIEHELLLTSNR